MTTTVNEGRALGLDQEPQPVLPNRGADQQVATDRSASRAGLGYQPALDGLRAIAVLAVLAYHADLAWAPGGFLGVDVFFVLSGFLITSLLLESAARLGSPDMKRFYLRRARRLLPALFAVLIGSTLLVITIAPDEAANQQRDLPAALVYLTNWVYVFTDQSYFEATGRPPMLEHLWSLAVEEQFYLIWPWVFLLAWRTGRSTRVRRWAAGGAIASTALMVLLSVVNGYPTQNDPSRVYFGTDTHAMGLLVGAALATVWIPRLARADLVPGARATVNAIGGITLLLLLVVFWQVDEDSSLLYRGGFLALSALVALLIVAATHPASQVGRILGSAPMRYIGTRSYGIYLWHWPIFLVTRPGLDVPVTGTANLLLRLLLTFGIAELSYRFLETPIRQHGFAGAWRRLQARMLQRGGYAATAAQRPMAILAVCTVLLLGMTVRLYTLPTQDDYLGGVTALSALESAEATAGSGADEPASQAPAEADSQEPPEEIPAEGAEPPAAAPAQVAPAGVLAVGESVMIGASGALGELLPGTTVDAEVGRQPGEVVERVGELAAAGALRESAVLHFGSNGNVGENGVRGILDTFRDGGVSRVAVVNISVPRRWAAPNNAILADVVAEYPNAVLIDWDAAVRADPSLLAPDGVHPTAAGVRVYAQLVADGLASLEAADAAQD